MKNVLHIISKVLFSLILVMPIIGTLGLLTGGAVMGNIMLALNLYLLWKNREAYESLWTGDQDKSGDPATAQANI